MYERKFYARNKIEAMYGRPLVNAKVERGNLFALNLKLKYFLKKKKKAKKEYWRLLNLLNSGSV